MRSPLVNLPLIAVVAVAALASGCGPNCQSTCGKLYFDDQCGIPTPGRETEEAFRDCVDECEYALARPGDLDGYDPDERQTSGETVVLVNEVQAAAWMECVDQTACEDIDDGYCEPH
jgi:hypothetical protein